MLDEAGIGADYHHLSSHHAVLPFHFDSFDIRLHPAYRSVIGLLRDPRDTVVSGYHHCTSRLAIFEGSISDFLRSPFHGLEKVCRFNLELAGIAAGQDNVALVTYEGLKDNAGATLRLIGDFVGRPIELTKAVAIAQNNSFEQMRERELRGEYIARYGEVFGQHKVRRGVVGSHRDELAQKDIDYADSVLQSLNYDERLEGLFEVASLAARTPKMGVASQAGVASDEDRP